MKTKKIKVAYILTPITFGGSEKVNLNFLKSVDRNAYQVQPILLVRPWEEETYFARKLRSYGYGYETIPTRKMPGKDPLRVTRVAHRIFSLLYKSSYDLVHSHGYFADICSLPVARLMGIKSVSTCHGFISNNKKLALYNKFDRIVLRLSNRVICVSESIKDSLLSSGLGQDKIRVIPNAVAISLDRGKMKETRKAIRKKLFADDNHLVVGYAGRLSEEKGLRPLMQAFGMLVQMRPQCRLWLIGDGPLRPELQKLADSAGISEHITFLGFRQDVEELMMGMDVFVLPSFTEGTPMALLEAMSLGIPVVASAVGQIPKIVSSGENGLLISAGDISELSKSVLKIFDDKAFARQLSEKAFKTVEKKYSTHVWIKKLEDIYSELVN